MKQRAEKAAKASKVAMEKAKKAQRKLPGRICGCRTVRVYFNHNNRWHNCPRYVVAIVHLVVLV